MTWSVEYNTQDDDIRFNGEDTEEVNASMLAAVDAAGIILGRGVLGTSDKNYRVSIVGHANPKNEPVPGWSNDSVSISIYQTDKVT